MTLKQTLESQVKAWEFLGQPALLERFVLRNGKAFKGRKRIGRKGPAKQCFMNAHKFVDRRDDGSQYVEGFTINIKLPFPIHHAWVSVTGDDAMDPTLDAATHEYYGVAFTREQMIEASSVTGYYGIFSDDMTFNTEVLFRLDPELEEIVSKIKPRTNAEMLAAYRKEETE